MAFAAMLAAWLTATRGSPLGLHLNEPKANPDGIHRSLLAGLLEALLLVVEPVPELVPLRLEVEAVLHVG